MFKPTNYGVSTTTDIQLTEEEEEIAESNHNLETIKEIQSSWIGGSEPLMRDSRIFLLEGSLRKLCRKGIKKRYFFLFNDILVYGIPLGNRRYGKQHVLALSDLAVHDIETEYGKFAMEFDHRRKSFLVFANSQAEKQVWLTKLQQYITRVTGRKQTDSVDARALWVPDSEATKCMLCSSDFSLIKRRHHCRNCGKVVCAACSSHKTVLYKMKMERVCDPCYEQIEATGRPSNPAAMKEARENLLQRRTGDLASAGRCVEGMSSPTPGSNRDSSEEDSDETDDEQKQIRNETLSFDDSASQLAQEVSDVKISPETLTEADNSDTCENNGNFSKEDIHTEKTQPKKLPPPRPPPPKAS